MLPVVVSETFLKQLFDSIKQDAKTKVKIDLPNQTITNEATGESELTSTLTDIKYCLENGLDDIDFLVKNKDKIETYETQHNRVLAGDGIGPEISKQGVAVMAAVCKKVWS